MSRLARGENARGLMEEIMRFRESKTAHILLAGFTSRMHVIMFLNGDGLEKCETLKIQARWRALYVTVQVVSFCAKGKGKYDNG